MACAELLAIGNVPAELNGREALERRGGESMSMTTGDRVVLGGVETNWERRSEIVYADGTCGGCEARKLAEVKAFTGRAL